LESNPDKAFHVREIADEVLDTDWEAAHESTRLKEELDEDEYYERVDNDDLPDSHVPAFSNTIETVRLDHDISKLLDEGQIVQREVDADPLDFPYDWDTVVVFRYAGD